MAMGQTPTEVFALRRWERRNLTGRGASRIGGGGGISTLEIGRRGLPPTAPLPTASATTTGIALLRPETWVSRFLAPVGEGCSSSGEFWEAMNLASLEGTAHMLHDTEQSDSPRHVCSWSVGC